MDEKPTPPSDKVSEKSQYKVTSLLPPKYFEADSDEQAKKYSAKYLRDNKLKECEVWKKKENGRALLLYKLME